jgi:hypothetical protein
VRGQNGNGKFEGDDGLRPTMHSRPAQSQNNQKQHYDIIFQIHEARKEREDGEGKLISAFRFPLSVFS